MSVIFLPDTPDTSLLYRTFYDPRRDHPPVGVFTGGE